MDLAKIKKMQEIINKKNYSFNENQLNEIHKGLQNDLDFLIYLNPAYSAQQMSLIRIGLEKGYNVSMYSNPNFSYEDMKKIYDKLDGKITTDEKDSKKQEMSKFQKSLNNEHEHHYKKIILKMPTCSNEGLQRLTCECGDVKEEPIEKIKHNYVTTKILPTCQKKGYTTYRCISCGDSYNDDYVDKTEHTYSSEIIEEPTCRKTGKIKYTCVNCNDTYIKEIPTIDHNYDSKIIEPTCIEEGYRLHTCSMCGTSYRDELKPKIPHAYTYWETIKEPTCTKEGMKERSCLRCKAKDFEKIPALGHDYDLKTIMPTCTEVGQIIGVCKRCGDEYVEKAIPMIAHTYDNWTVIKEPTIYKKGLRKRTCTCCGAIDEEEIDSKKLTMESAQEQALNEIYEKQKQNISKRKQVDYDNLFYEPIKGSYTKEEFDNYIKKKKYEFEPREILLIEQGLMQGLDVKIYANPKYEYDIMQELKKGLEHGLDLTKYTKDYDAQQINEIRLGIEHEINFKRYLNPNFSSTQMREIRLALEEGLNVNKLTSLEGCPGFLSSTPIGKMFQPKYSTQDMYERRTKLTQKNKK